MKPFEAILTEATQHDKIVVSGAQRSGTRIAARILASELGYRYIDEADIGTHLPAFLFDLIEKANDGAQSEQKPDGFIRQFVVQCPALSHVVHELPEDVLIVWMMRDLEDIQASEKASGWDTRHDGAEFERLKYRNKFRVLDQQTPISAIKNEVWATIQRPQIKNWIELPYESLNEHPMFIEEMAL